MPYSPLRGLLLLVLALAGLATPAIAADEFSAQVEKILEVGWGKNFLVLEPAREHYEKATRLKASDPLAPYAFALAHAKQNRHVDARKFAEEAAALDDKFLPARDLVIFQAVRARDYDVALAKVDDLTRRLPEQPDTLELDDYLQRARFLGRLFGYLAGPVSGRVDAAQFQAVRQRLLDRLTAEADAAFEASEQEVVNQFAELRLGRDQTKEDVEAAQAEAKKREAERLAKEKEQVAANKEEVEAQAEAARREADGILSEIDKNFAPLERKFNDLAAQAAPIRRRMADISGEISRLQFLIDGTDDPNERFRLGREIDRLGGLYDRLQRDYVFLDREAARVRADLAALEQRRAATINKYEGVMKKLGKAADNLRKTAKRIDRLEDDNAQPPTGNTAGVRATTAILQSLTTYVNFPLESEKQRVLAALK